MVALRGKEIDAFLSRPDPGRPIILLYGPDAGLVRERAYRNAEDRACQEVAENIKTRVASFFFAGA